VGEVPPPPLIELYNDEVLEMDQEEEEEDAAELQYRRANGKAMRYSVPARVAGPRQIHVHSDPNPF